MTNLPKIQDNSEPSKPLTFVSDDFNRDTYEKVTQRAKLRDVRLIDTSYHVDMQCFFESDEGDVDLKQAFSGKPKWQKLSEDSGTLAGGYEWIAEIKFRRKRALKLQSQYVVIYSGLKGCDPDYARLYFNKLARFTTYPYFRSHFSYHSASSGLSLAPLPSLTDRVD